MRSRQKGTTDGRSGYELLRHWENVELWYTEGVPAARVIEINYNYKKWVISFKILE